MIRRDRVLVVDNNLADLELIREVLPLHGVDADIDTAVDGDEALERLARADGPDAVVLDLHLSRLHGRDVLARIRASARPGVPVIVCTTAASEAVRRDCLALGAEAVLLKPRHLAGWAALAEALRRCLGARTGEPR